jgi:hypothetical protein
MADRPPTKQNHQMHVVIDGGYESTISYISDPARGTIQLDICNICHYITATCEHENNTWNKDGTVLTCDLCGIDGT